MDWKVLAISVPLLFASYQSLAKFLPKGVSVFLINAYAFLAALVVMLLLHFVTQPNKSLQLSGTSLGIAIAIGFLLGFGNFGIIKSYSLGAPQSLFTVLFYVSLIVYGVILGILIFHEKLHPIQVGGMVLAATGLFLVAYFRK